jgi:hypothetical protein
VFHAIQGVYEGMSVSKLYHEDNTYGVHRKCAACCKSSLVQVQCLLLLVQRRGSKKVKRLIMIETQPMSFWSFIRYIKEKMTAR